MQLEIIELLDEDWKAKCQSDEGVLHPLTCLRATCKRLEERSNPALFQSIQMSTTDPRKYQIYKEYAPKLARYLREIAFVVFMGDDELDLVYHTVFQHATNLRELKPGLYQTDTEQHTLLLDAVARLQNLEVVMVGEVDYDEEDPLGAYDLVRGTFNHRFLNHVLDHHAQSLRTLVLYSMHPIHETTFRKLRDTTPQLRSFKCTRAITIETRAAFTEPQRWACADRLEFVYFRRCGVHAATIARHLAMGVFGKLHSLHMIMCGDELDDSMEPVGATWAIPPLESVEIEHFMDWEMDKLQTIHAKKVYATRVWSAREICIGAFGKAATFPGAMELHVAKTWDDEKFEELRKSCAKRGLMKVERDHAPMASCMCHPD